VVNGPDVPGYELLDVLGRGGYGIVYLARQAAVGREVALKVDHRALLTERDQRRFLREVHAAGQLSAHPHVVKLYDAGTLADGRPYLVMERCRESLDDVVRREGPLPPARVRDLGVQLADALAAAHAAGILHRDIKPANVLVNGFGVVGLSDFGLASILDADGRQTATVEALTPVFAATEAFQGAAPTPLFDVYSLAATLYALLSGHPPRMGHGTQPTIYSIVAAHAQPVPPVPGAPPALDAVLRQALESDPARRTPSALALRDALAAVDVGPEDVVASPWAGGAGLPPVSTSGPIPPPGSGSISGPVPGPGPTQGLGPAAVTSRGTRRRRVALAAAAVVAIAAGGYAVLPRFTRPPWQGPVTPQLSSSAGRTPAAGATTPVAAPPSSPQVPSSGTAAATKAPSAAPATTATAVQAGRPPGSVVDGCPASRVSPAAGCPATPECFGGLVVSSGILQPPRHPACSADHVWETFAEATIPPGTALPDGPDQEVVAGTSLARRLCTPQVLAASRAGAARQIPAERWTIDVLPPTQARYDAGDRTFRCIATITGGRATGSAFHAPSTFTTAPF